MDNSHVNEDFRTQVQPALKSKLEEFRLLGVDSVREQGLWEFLVKKKWKKVKHEMKLYEMIQDILSVRVSDYLNYVTIESYKTSEFSFDNEAELKELLK
ncbi:MULTISPECIES: post-transcriptional regulator [Bacillaceae]|uniref:post-transcriptional regulator n=1 Tax=Bacillaceae TaxID=186817 RepID=UPI001BE8D997|nr:MULTISPECIES: post-transcriptional regulator [Bacillaceae]MBT2656797.1 post-transcriptional regulator [Bacillus sp. ISL-18]ULT55797.1 post-transcriptional regulator [Neobacillus drentensis]